MKGSLGSCPNIINNWVIIFNLPSGERGKDCQNKWIFAGIVIHVKEDKLINNFLRFWNVVYNWGDAGYALSRGAVSALLNRFSTQVSALSNLFALYPPFLNPFSTQVTALINLFSAYVSAFRNPFST